LLDMGVPEWHACEHLLAGRICCDSMICLDPADATNRIVLRARIDFAD